MAEDMECSTVQGLAIGHATTIAWQGKSPMMRTIWLVAALVLMATTATAAGPAAVRKQIENTMLVTGYVLIEPDGTVSGWEIDHRDKLPLVVAELVEKSAPAWEFEPVVIDELQRKAKARMSLRIVARKLEGQDMYRIGIVGGHFGDDAIPPEERSERDDSLRSIELKPPTYPMAALEMGARGTVYVVVRIGRDGVVTDSYAEQVNLKVLGSEGEMQRMRNLLSRSAVRAAQAWKFQTPSSADEDQQYWYARVPVEYAFYGQDRPGYGEWEAYVPGPRMDAPWQSLEDLDGFEAAPDALVAGQVYEIGRGRKLLTPLDGG